jgi:hypothetical protein
MMFAPSFQGVEQETVTAFPRGPARAVLPPIFAAAHDGIAFDRRRRIELATTHGRYERGR